MRYFRKRKILWTKANPVVVGAAGAIVFWLWALKSISGTIPSVENQIYTHGTYTVNIIKTNYSMGENIEYALMLSETHVGKNPSQALTFPLETDTPYGTLMSVVWRNMHHVDIYIATKSMHGTLIIKKEFDGDTTNTEPLIAVIHYYTCLVLSPYA